METKTEKTLMDKATLKVVNKWLSEGGTSVSYVKQLIAEELEKDSIDDESAFVASDEASGIDWNDLAHKKTWREGFEAGAAWMKNKKQQTNNDSILFLVKDEMSKMEHEGLMNACNGTHTNRIIIEAANYLHKIGHASFHNTINTDLKKSVIALLDNIGVDVNNVDEQGCSHLVQDALYALKQAGGV